MQTATLDRGPPADLHVLNAPRSSDFNTSHFLESLICDLHWTCMHAATLHYVIKATLHRDIKMRLGAWRHLLVDNTSISRLGLRYCRDIGVSRDTQDAAEEFLLDMSRSLAATQAVLQKIGRQAEATPRDLHAIGGSWAQTSKTAESALAALEHVTRTSLAAEYAENARIIAGFLREGGGADGSRLNEWGELELPKLAQRRLHARTIADKPCQLHIGGQKVHAVLQDASRSGLGIICNQILAQGSKLTVELADGRKLAATVARSQGRMAGLHLAVPLSYNDPVFARG